ncbi:HEAT repeat domain-containing protein [Nitratireductor aquibiodomus]|nr:HEAT repeat domain-containing protein [Nitratireductor aquibiodomus]
MSALDNNFSSLDPSVRLNAALFAGLNPSPSDLNTLIERCAVEPDFQVREMLTWALIRLPTEIVVPRLLAELARDNPQARSQALHTLSKIREASAWPAVAARLDDDDQDVVRTAWYTAVALVPEDKRNWLARRLAERFGKGGRETQLSLSRALVALGEATIAPILKAASKEGNESIRQHATATQRLLDDPASGFAGSIDRARREVALGRTKSTKG